MSAAPPASLGLLRRGIDGLDDALLLLLAGRRRLVVAAAAVKRRAGLPARDPDREARVLSRGLGVAARLDLPPSLARGQLALVIDDACRLQGVEGGADARTGPAEAPAAPGDVLADTLLRWLPPPARLAPLVRAVPRDWQRRALEAVLARLLATPLARGDFDVMAGRRLGIEVCDVGLAWVLTLHEGRLRPCEGPPDAVVRGTATDLLSLAGRLDDADTLFFQRRLELAGDTELGLTVRNLLDRLPWDALPLAARIALDRAARFARAARDAHRGAG